MLRAVDNLQCYLGHIISDRRLTLVHLSLSVALCHEWSVNQFRPYLVFRRLRMKAARIRSKTTYHKAIQELKKFGYLEYYPSYHPMKGTRIVTSRSLKFDGKGILSINHLCYGCE
jgi:hypothetical protein